MSEHPFTTYACTYLRDDVHPFPSGTLSLRCFLPPELAATRAAIEAAKLQKSTIEAESTQLNAELEELREGQAKSAAKLHEEVTMKETHCTLLSKKAENLNGKIAKVCLGKRVYVLSVGVTSLSTSMGDCRV